MPGVAGSVMASNTPAELGTALKAKRPEFTSVTHKMPVPAIPLYEVMVGCPTPARPAEFVAVLPARVKNGAPEESVPNL